MDFPWLKLKDPIMYGFYLACVNNDPEAINILLADEDTCKKILVTLSEDEKPLYVYHAINQRYEQVCLIIASKFPFTLSTIYRSWRENQTEVSDLGNLESFVLPFTDHQSGAQYALDNGLIVEFEYLFKKFHTSPSLIDRDYTAQTIHTFICRACAANDIRFLTFILAQNNIQKYLYYGRFQDVPERPMGVALQNASLRTNMIKLLLLHDQSNLLFTPAIFECVLNTQDLLFITEILSLDRHRKCYQSTDTGNKSRMHTLFESSFHRGNLDICAIMIKDIVRCKAVYEAFSLLLTASEKDISFLLLLLENEAGEWINHKATFHTKTEGMHSPLSYACYRNARPIVDLFLASGAIIDGLELIEAVRSGDAELVSVILGHGGIQYVDKVDHRKHTSLSMACLTGNLNSVQLLLQAGASAVSTRTLYDAVSSKNIEIVKTILRLPAGSRFIDGDNVVAAMNQTATKRNPLERACRMRCINIAQLLLDYGARVGEVEFSLFYDCEAGDYALLRLLLENGANPGSITGYHRRAQQFVLTAMEELGNSSLLTTGPLLLELLGEYDYLIRFDQPAFQRINIFPPKVHLYGPTEQLEVVNGFDRKTNPNSFTTYLEQGYNPEEILEFILAYYKKYPKLGYPFFTAYVSMGWFEPVSSTTPRIGTVVSELKRLRLAAFVNSDRVLFDALTDLNVDFEWNEDLEREFKKAPLQMLSVLFPSTTTESEVNIPLWLKACAFCCEEWLLHGLEVLTNLNPKPQFLLGHLFPTIVAMIQQYRDKTAIKESGIKEECKQVLMQLKPWILPQAMKEVAHHFDQDDKELSAVLLFD